MTLTPLSRFIALVPAQIGLTQRIANPATPRQPPAVNRTPGTKVTTEVHGVGAPRVYLDIQSHPPNVAYPPRPVPGSVADLDHVMKHCDFGTGKVRVGFTSIQNTTY